MSLSLTRLRPYGFGQSEQLLPAALRGIPLRRWLSRPRAGCAAPTPGWFVTPAPARFGRGVDASLRALDTDYIEL